MLPFFGPRFGNPSSVHRWGREARTALDEARERVARCLGASADEVVFTSCGTEADNMALIGVWRARRGEGRRAAVSTPIEHKAVLGAAAPGRARRGARSASSPSTRDGRVDRRVVRRARARRCRGLLGDVGEQRDRHDAGRSRRSRQRAKARGVVFHTDAVQAFGKVDDRRAHARRSTCSRSRATRSARRRGSARCTSAAARRSSR